MHTILRISLLTSILFASCKNTTTTKTDTNTLKSEIIANSGKYVIEESYRELAELSAQLYASTQNFQLSPTSPGLEQLKTEWKACRSTWEKTEAWLFGPVSTDNIDPRIDTWPVDFNALDSVLAGTQAFDESYIHSLDDALKGFHPIEYLLWGSNSNKTLNEFTPKQINYLVALALNLKNLTTQVHQSWVNHYTQQLITAGNGSTEFSSRKAALLQLVDAMAGICDEVANGKMEEPFLTQNPMAEESPFAKNSIVDFTNNLHGILLLYQGAFQTDGKGIEDFVRAQNTQLDLDIKQKHASAMQALQAITLPFGDAISQQQVQVQAAIHQINALKVVLEGSLRDYILQYGE